MPPLIYLPAAICFIWAVILAMTAFRMRGFWLSLGLMLTMCVYFLSKYYVISHNDGLLLDAAVLIREVTGVCIVPMVALLLLRLRPGVHFGVVHVIWLIVPAVLLTGGILNFVLAGRGGRDVPDSFSQFWLFDLYFALMVVSGLFLLFFVSLRARKDHAGIKGVLAFMGGKGTLRSEHLLGTLMVAIMAAMALEHPWEAWVVSPFLLAAGFMMLFGTDDRLTRSDLGHLMRYNRKADAAPVRQAPEEYDAGSAIFAGASINAVSRVWDGSSLLSRFQHLMLDEQLFLQPRLTLADVAELLHTNKTYVSKMVNEIYKVGFPELINTLRVDYAEQYILRHREARQDEIAGACGFLSASSFNNTFKNVTGMPPRQWVTNWDALHKS